MLDLQYATHRVRFHYDKAAVGWRTTVFHAWWCGKYLWRVRKELGYRRWGVWVRNKANFPGCVKTATNWVRINKMYKEPPEMTMRDALQGLTGSNKSTKKFDPDGILRSRMFKEFLKLACRDWGTEELQALKSALSDDTVNWRFEGFFRSALNQLKPIIKDPDYMPTRKEFFKEMQQREFALSQLLPEDCSYFGRSMREAPLR